jgi:hypothetical protein
VTTGAVRLLRYIVGEDCGAATTEAEIGRSGLVAARVPLLARALPR